MTKKKKTISDWDFKEISQSRYEYSKFDKKFHDWTDKCSYNFNETKIKTILLQVKLSHHRSFLLSVRGSASQTFLNFYNIYLNSISILYFYLHNLNLKRRAFINVLVKDFKFLLEKLLTNKKLFLTL